MKGWTGRTITVDLSENSVTESRTGARMAKDFIGGRGLGAAIFSDIVPANCDPLDNRNALIFTTGPLTGTAAPMSGAFNITTISPLTKTIFNTVQKGHFAKEMKWSGIDALAIKGTSQKPVYLQIEGEEVNILDASHLWGKNVSETVSILKDKGEVAAIGRAGEKLVSISNIVSDGISEGRGGPGAVAGSKNLKAVVVKGEFEPEIAEQESFDRAVENASKLLCSNTVTSKGLSKYGSAVFLSLLNHMKAMPSYNFGKTYFENAERLSASTIMNFQKTERNPCYMCPVGCRHVYDSGERVPEYDEIWAFGPNLGNDDLRSITDASGDCYEYGIDPISCGSIIAVSGEMDPKMVPIVGEGEQMKERKDKKRSFQSLSSKGSHIPGYDPRELKGQALSYATSNRGACHLNGYMLGPEVAGKPFLLDRTELSGKAGLVQVFQNYAAALESLALCHFATFALSEVELAAMLSSATGIEYSAADLMQAGERIWNLERMFNMRAGFDAEDDTLPEMFFGKDGLDRNEFEKAISDYYHFRDWRQNGNPSAKKLEELGLLRQK
ncbi:aldehyde ferredoxin oxidoreductase family protein [Methanococcoides sp. FTZ1]|uniref:aldehyde ferredoxin oxidoreductase family protein n=1 Tax=Methanococcoides sp. FTZ1 TaxID=3439061 RepID=UPI003F83DDB0